MKKKFKPATWKDDYDYGTTIVNRSEARVPFGMVLNIARRHDKWHWSFGNEYFVISKGSCVHMEKAKAHAEEAFSTYVESNLAKCLDEDYEYDERYAPLDPCDTCYVPIIGTAQECLLCPYYISEEDFPE